jgi:diguanylate cyclase (GGDEF)-like protein
MFLDLDNFKSLNDSEGHFVGDLLLLEVAQRLGQCVREVDSVARFGGDEFVVLLNELHGNRAEATAEASLVAEQIRGVLEQPYVLRVLQEGRAETIVEHRCTTSIGVVVFVDHDGSQDDVLKWADGAMYEAKEAGGNQMRLRPMP